VLSPASAWAQKHLEIIENSKTRNFKKLVEEVENYYKDKDKGKGTGYKQFKRWEHFNQYHLDSDGNIQNVAQQNFDAMYDYNLRNAREGFRTDAFQGNWIAFGPTSHVNSGGWNGGIGRVNTVVVDPSNSNIVYAGTPAGGLWRSLTGGNSWVSLTDGISSLGVSGIAIDPTSAASNRTIYILTGDGDGGDTRSVGVLRSTNNGLTWQSTGLSWITSANVRGYKLVMQPGNNQVLLAATTNGVYRTTNGGVSWTLVLSGTTYDLEYRPGTPTTVYAARSGSFLRSLDGGATWTAITSGVPTSGRFAISVTPANTNYVYLLQGTVPATGQFGGVYRSADGGATFTLRSNTPNVLGYDINGNDNANQAWYDLAIAAATSNAEEVHVGGINCWKSVNGGSTWTITSHWVETSAGAGNYTHADIHCLEFYGNTIYCGSDGAVTRSTNNATDWSIIWSGMQILQPYRISVSPTVANKVICGTQDNGSNRFEGGVMYHEQGADGMDCAIDQTNANTFYMSSQYGNFVRTTDNGVNFAGITPSGQSGAWVTPFLISPTTNTTVFVGYSNLYRSTNQGTTWTNISNGLIGGGNIAHIAIAATNTNVIFASKGTTLYRTTNGGTSWTTIAGLPATQSIARILVDPTNANNIWVSYGGYTAGTKVYSSTNQGATWTNISGSLPNIPANCLAFKSTAPTKLFVGTDVGAYVLENGAADWTPFSNSLPNVIIQDIKISGSLMYIGTYGRGIWRSQIDNCISSLSFTGTQQATATFEASSSITSTANILNGSNIKYKAGSFVRLSPGFRVTSNTYTNFKASVGPCGSAFREVAAPLSGMYTGPMEGVKFAESDDSDAEDSSLETLVAFPNPTSTVTNLEYYIQNDADVTITLMDATGRKVKDLMVSSPHSKGKYVTTIDANNLTKGLYVCTLLYGTTAVSVKIEVAGE
jgi:hypothetical protein